MADRGYKPPYEITPAILSLLGDISEWIGRHAPAVDALHLPLLRRENRIRSIRSSLAIEGNTLSLEQVTAILDGKRVLGRPREILEVRNAFVAYEELDRFNPFSERDLLAAHRLMMTGLIDDAGLFRSGGVGVFQGKRAIHIAPPADKVPHLMADLLSWLKKSAEPPLIASSIFHYEFEFIHPFSDGNGRMGRLWQTRILSRWRSLFSLVPVETIVHDHQSDYYAALAACNKAGDSTRFIEFMLSVIKEALAQVKATEQVTVQVTEQVKRLLAAFGTEALPVRDLMAALALRHRPAFLASYLQPALAAGLIEMTQPDSPRSPTQRYRLTAKGLRVRGE